MKTTLHPSISKLAKFSWAPYPIRAYQLPKGGGGLGRIGPRDPAAFNIAWALGGQEALRGGTPDLQLNAVNIFANQEVCNTQVIQGAKLGDWLTLYDPKEFSLWFSKNKRNIDTMSRLRIEEALSLLEVVT